ncbi:hypothetical protein CEF21_09170 [Bacillus sp. FJAT-42376]|uniref:hypothetical protein n=1 Tax=Bacillus sp. FJAT-42376 TaxID=2014076 RepID=UPI000F4DF2D6|nr:hypothetical protein [Bacillus sp. FJAT-42376]AZB42446.1 hypothetical protein CEF21_09170 [Bacillus sp. FJAT-42376]
MFNKWKERLEEVSVNGLSIPISSQMLERVFRLKAKEVQNLKAEITEDFVSLSGTVKVKKMMFEKDIPIKIVLKPLRIEKRTIIMELVKVKPMDIGLINQKLLNKPPFAEYRERTIRLDLDAWDAVRRIPFGQFKSFEMKKDAIVVKVWI